MDPAPSIRLPSQWPDSVKSGILHAIALASTAMVAAHGLAGGRHRLHARLDQAHQEIALLREELEIKDGRWLRSHTRKRPHFTPVQRLRILELRAARGWTLERTARQFLVDTNTLQNWIRRVDERGERDLVQTRRPINRYPDYLRHLVRDLKRLIPSMGDERMAQVLARCGLVLSASTLRRFVREPFEPLDRDDQVEAKKPPRRAVARRPGDVWHVDLTAVPTRVGFWTPWFPHALPQRWPFCWWVAEFVDQMSRTLVGFAVFRKLPASGRMQAVLDRAIARQGFPPRCIVSDKGQQFKCRSYRRWCRRRGVRARYGYLGEPNSIPIIERFMRTLKQECFRRMLVPMTAEGVRHELRSFATWYNRHRPHTHLDGRTPHEVMSGRKKRRRRIETRPLWRSRRACARVAFDVRYVDGKKHLPVVTLRRAA